MANRSTVYEPFRQEVSVTRYLSADSYSGGDLVEASTETFEVNASVQPLRPKEMELLPEGRRESAAFRLYTDYQLNAANERTKINADRVTLFGESYEILSCAPWQNSLIPHYKAIAVRIAEGNG